MLKNGGILKGKFTFYIRNLKYAHLTLTFRLGNIHLVFSITQIQMDIVYRKTSLNREFSRFLMYKHKYKLKISYTKHEFLALNTYLSLF